MNSLSFFLINLTNPDLEKVGFGINSFSLGYLAYKKINLNFIRKQAE